MVSNMNIFTVIWSLSVLMFIWYITYLVSFYMYSNYFYTSLALVPLMVWPCTVHGSLLIWTTHFYFLLLFSSLGIASYDLEKDYYYKYLTAYVFNRCGQVFFGYSVEGIENLPAGKPSILIGYHGFLPIDVAVGWLDISSRNIVRFNPQRMLAKLPIFGPLLKIAAITAFTVEECGKTLRGGESLIITPGAAIEGMNADHDYKICWDGITGYAKVVKESGAPVVPFFTENINEAAIYVPFVRELCRRLNNITGRQFHLPIGLFPVKMTTHFGEPIVFSKDATIEEIAAKVELAVKELRDRHQTLPGNLWSALRDRFPRSNN